MFYRRLTASTLWHLLNLGANIIVGLGLTPIFIHSLGVDNYGLWVFAASLSVARGVLGLFDFGLQTAIVKFVAEFTAHTMSGQPADLDPQNRIGKLLSLVLIGYSLLGLSMATLISLGACFGMGIVTGLFRIPPDRIEVARMLLLIVAAQTLFDFPALALSGVLSGLQRFDITRVWNLIRLIVYAALSVALIAVGFGVYSLALATFVGELLRFFGHLYYLRRLLPNLRLTRQIDPAMARRVISFSGQLFGSQLLQIVAQSMDKAIIAIVLTTTALTDYDVSERLYLLAYALVNLIGPFAVPMAVAFHSRNTAADRAALHRLMVRITRYTAAFTVPIVLIIIVLASPLTNVWVGAEFARTVPATRWFVGYLMFWALVNSGQNLLVSVERVTIILPIFGIGTVVNLITSLIAIRSLGVLGVIVGTTAGNGVACLLYMIAFRQAFGLTLADWWRRILLSVYPQAICGALVTFALSLWHTPTNWLAVTTFGAAGWTTFAILFTLTGLAPDERVLLRKWLGLSRS